MGDAATSDAAADEGFTLEEGGGQGEERGGQTGTLENGWVVRVRVPPYSGVPFSDSLFNICPLLECCAWWASSWAARPTLSLTT